MIISKWGVMGWRIRDTIGGKEIERLYFSITKREAEAQFKQEYGIN